MALPELTRGALAGILTLLICVPLFAAYSAAQRDQEERAAYLRRIEQRSPSAVENPSASSWSEDSGAGFSGSYSRRGSDSSPYSVHVRSYTRRDGTVVRAHSRRAPR